MLELFMVLAFLMKPGIVSTSVGRLVCMLVEDSLPFGNYVLWIPRQGGDARVLLSCLSFRNTNTG